MKDTIWVKPVLALSGITGAAIALLCLYVLRVQRVPV